MRKFSSFLAAAVTVFAAVSCNKEINNIDPIAPEADAVVYTAYVDGAETKTSLGETTGEGLNMKTSAVWNTNDAITIHNGTTGYTFTTSESGSKAKFTTTDGGFDAGAGVMAIYPSGEWTVNVATKTVNTNIPTYQQAQIGTYDSNAAVAVAYSEDNALQFKNATALLKFTVNTENVTHIVFHGNNEEAITGNVEVVLGNDGVEVECLDTEFTQDENTWTGKGTWVECYAYHDNDNKYFAIGEEYYIAVAPQTFNNGVTVKFRINDGEEIVVKTTENPVVTKANTILDLGELEYVTAIWGVCSSVLGWDVAISLDMAPTGNGWYTLENLELYKDDEFKFVTNRAWDASLGGEGSVLIAEDGTEYSLTSDNGQNIRVNKNGVFTLSLNPEEKKFKVECTEEYTDLMVNITVVNKAEWNPLEITLKSGETVIASGTVTNNTFAISGNYIGETLSCILNSGDKTSDVYNLTITKTGATVTLEENTIYLKFKLNTDNAKKWWGNTSNIHVWNTGTSLDTEWPGTTMISEGDYTWSIIVPSELVGKTINFLIHNGNGWQSPDATVTIADGGNTVMGTSIGIE